MNFPLAALPVGLRFLTLPVPLWATIHHWLSRRSIKSFAPRKLSRAFFNNAACSRIIHVFTHAVRLARVDAVPRGTVQRRGIHERRPHRVSGITMPSLPRWEHLFPWVGWPLLDNQHIDMGLRLGIPPTHAGRRVASVPIVHQKGPRTASAVRGEWRSTCFPWSASMPRSSLNTKRIKHPQQAYPTA
jgi:hypothetical protein